MIYANWNDAAAYAKWVGKRLPTETEWEFATRGSLVGKKYSWGDDESLVRDYANSGGTGGKDKSRWIILPTVISFIRTLSHVYGHHYYQSKVRKNASIYYKVV